MLSICIYMKGWILELEEHFHQHFIRLHLIVRAFTSWFVFTLWVIRLSSSLICFQLGHYRYYRSYFESNHCNYCLQFDLQSAPRSFLRPSNILTTYKELPQPIFQASHHLHLSSTFSYPLSILSRTYLVSLISTIFSINSNVTKSSLQHNVFKP